MFSWAVARDRAASGKRASTSSPQVKQLKQRWPYREQLIDQLADRITSTKSSQAPAFVFGPPASGKTAVVRDVFRLLGVRHAYVNCVEVNRTKPLLSSILHQLKGAKRRRDEGYDCSVKCDSIAHFLLALPGVVRQRAGGRACWVVLDNAHRVAGTELLSVLMEARVHSGVNLGLVLVSSMRWSSGWYMRGDTAAGTEAVATISVGSYSPQQLLQIVEHRRNAELGGAPSDAVGFNQFLKQLVPILARVSNNVQDLQAAVALLYPRYQEHQREMLQQGRQPQAAELFARMRKDVSHVTQNLDLHQRGLLAARRQSGLDAGASTSAAAAGGGGGSGSAKGLEFELPFVSKFLLVAAFIASRNKPTADRQVFDPGYRKRGRKDAQASDRATEAALAARLRGPQAFPLERLLHIFFALYPQHQGEEEEEEEEGGGGPAGGASQEAWQEMQQGEVLMQLSTLVSLRLLSQTSVDVLEGSLYRCKISEDMAHALARNLRLNLTDYLKMG